MNIAYWKRLGDPTFKQHFRMDRGPFESLVVVVGRHMSDNGLLQRQGMPIDEALMMTLWALATPDSFRSTAVTFRKKGRGSVHNQYRTMIKVLCDLRQKYIQWPSRWEKQVIARNFYDMYGYPSVLGCIDGTHIRMTAPLEQPQRYVNRHHDYSVLVQAVCDHRLLFRDIFVGQPGAVGDVRMFQRSPLGIQLFRRLDLTDDLHILGDGAYPLSSKLLVPYRDYGNLTQRQRFHNYHLSRCRATIERAFALLKQKWRRLKFFPSLSIEYANMHIVACMVLHNFIILEEQYEDFEDEPDMVPDDVTDQQLAQQEREEGILKRNYIAALLHP
ncbi:uncharacterized protein LOC113211807 [Frankliniella occidentalis]|uniref:Uncharacterized protein LOC113211807 n=1 Tax=Frankliniella occidentalis TaxID=133901 RepID=A0A6J1SZ16_FRAOC|nr:uncharacterized protein LOC113211807 [Frankliniella occidentalis]